MFLMSLTFYYIVNKWLLGFMSWFKISSQLLNPYNLCGKQNNGSHKDIHVLIPTTCEHVLLHCKGELSLQMELRVLIS